MRKQQQLPMEAAVGFAADRRGEGVAYARLRTAAGARLLRLSFRVQRYAGLGSREISYGALTAVAAALRERGIPSARFALPDEQLVLDINEHRDVPPPLVLPYVRLGCVLNGFDDYSVVVTDGNDADLAARAQAEVALHVAA